MAAESEPASGSVMAIAAQRPAKRSSCSSSPTEAIAELPRPWPGRLSSRPTSPQQSSMMLRAVDMFEPLRLAAPSPFDDPRTPAAPAPPMSAPSSMPEMTAASMSSSFGRVCSSRS
jgi:hypothetical protein